MRIPGALLTGLVATVAMGGVISAFVNNASPYVTIAEAKASGADGVHLAGTLVKDTVQTDPTTGKITFDLKDKDGATAHVVYQGSTPGNLMEATRVVAVGGMKQNDFVAHQLLLKCPSKYEGQPATSTPGKGA